MGRREQRRTWYRKRGAEHLDNKPTASGQAQAGGLFINQRCLLQGVNQLQSVCMEGIGLRAVVLAWALYLHKAFLGLISIISFMLAFTQKALNQHLLYT